MQRLPFNHERCWELIPWVVNGRANEGAQRAVMAHTEECVECREELARHRELHDHMRGTDDVIAAPNAAWQKLLARIDTESDTAVARSYRVKRGWLVAALWLQLVAIAALAGALFRSASLPQPEYTTFATPQPVDRRAAVRVVFAPGTALDEVNHLLRSVGCDIVAGPSEAGVYTLGTTESSDVPQIIAKLRQHSHVLFAERAQSGAGTTQ